MENSAVSPPKDAISPWFVAECAVSKLNETEREYIKEQKNNLTFRLITERDLATDLQKNAWNLTMALPFDLCLDIFENSQYLEEKIVRDLLLSHYNMNENEETLFKKICKFGAANGLKDVMSSLYFDARVGKDKDLSNRMKYLDLMLNKNEAGGRSTNLRIILDNSAIDEDADHKQIDNYDPANLPANVVTIKKP